MEQDSCNFVQKLKYNKSNIIMQLKPMKLWILHVNNSYKLKYSIKGKKYNIIKENILNLKIKY